MAPSLLLDAHLARALADALVQHGLDVAHISTWQAGRWRTATDEDVLAAATDAGRVFVSLDAATLPAIARRWAEEGRRHAGLLILSPRVNQQDIGGQLDAILAALDQTVDQAWTNLIVYTRRR